MWRGEGRDLKTGIKRQHAGALVLRFVIMCGSSSAIANGQGGIGAAAVECVGVFASGEGVCNGDDDVGVAKAVGDDGVVVAAAAVDSSVGIEDTAAVAAAAFDDDVGAVDVAGGAV